MSEVEIFRRFATNPFQITAQIADTFRGVIAGRVRQLIFRRGVPIGLGVLTHGCCDGISFNTEPLYEVDPRLF
jgi:hypothetical protein